ncbi:hypothetical protein AEGHOMDF_5427 [Methylobacterium soli]|nr:hypothetical protein AEGHOMDF_5427 [Methylobacterium soli]
MPLSHRLILRLALGVLYVRIVLLPAWLEALARWDRRASEFAVARGDTCAAVAHLSRAIGRLQKAHVLVSGLRGAA